MFSALSVSPRRRVVISHALRLVGPTRSPAPHFPAPRADAAPLAMWLRRRPSTTARTYRAHAARFAAWLRLPDPEALPEWLRAAGRGPATERALAYLSEVAESRAPATHNLALATLRSLVRHLQRIDHVSWLLDIEPLLVTAYRDTAGPGAPAVARLRAAARDQATARIVTRGGHARRLPGDGRRAARDLAILRLLYDVALRRGELVDLDLAHVLVGPSGRPHALWVRGKGRRDRQAVPLPPVAAEALVAWLARRGVTPGPLFVACGGRRPSGRLDGRSIAKLLERLAERAGLTQALAHDDSHPPAQRVGCRARPHGLRHSAITEALERTHGDVRAVQAFSRHADPRTLNSLPDHGE